MVNIVNNNELHLLLGPENVFLFRYSPKELPEFPTCGHRPNFTPYSCCTLTMNDIRSFHTLFYSSKKRSDQNSFILAYCSATRPKRERPRTENYTKPKAISISYIVQKQDKTKVQVCREAFLGITRLKKDRVIRLLKKFLDTGEAPKECRGGDRVKDRNNDKKTSIQTFLESLKCTESHYCRAKSPHRIYLPCDLNIKKLWKIYNDKTQPSLQVRHCFFRNYFNANYNVGFGTPQTDMCSTCIQYKDKIKKCTDIGAKNELITNKRVHTLQAKSFYVLLKQNLPEYVTFSFDCEKNLPLPKVPDQKAYFSMQVNFYNFGVVVGNSNTKLSSQNVTCYVWTEADRPKGANEIASAIYNTLKSYTFGPEKEIVRLFCDGCGGQNKNSIVIGMLCYWFSCSSPPNIKEIQLIFPVVGHSYIPPDRVFGNIEKTVRKTSEILEPNEYINIIKEGANILKMGKDYKIFDWKTESQKILKPTTQWHFKFKPTKRFVFTKSALGEILLRGEPVYRSDLAEAKSVYRKGKNAIMMRPKVLPIGIPLKIDKIKSIGELLKTHFGYEWKLDERLRYFKNLFDVGLGDIATNSEEPEELDDENDG